MVQNALNPNQIEIREIEEADIPGFRACLDAVARERRFLALLEAPPLEKTREYIHASMEKGDIRVVAVAGSQLVGWCDIRPHGFEGLAHVGELGMGVLKEYRGRGIGLSLLREALRLARERRLEKVELDVFASNGPAIGLYEKEGFEVEGRKRHARKLDGTYDDIVVMGLFLKPPSSEKSVVIRIAERGDVKSLTRLAVETYTDAFGDSIEASELAGLLEGNLSESGIERSILRDVVLVAELDGRMTGFVHFSNINMPVETPVSKSKKLRRLYVHRDFQNKGIGSRLMEAALEHPLLKDAEYIYLEVWEHNLGAQRFYGRHGFEVIDQRRFILPSGAEADLELIMVRRAIR